MLTAAEVAGMRSTVESAMIDEATVTRGVSTGTLNPTTGEWTPTAGATVYFGACGIQGFGWEGTDVEVGGKETRLRRYKAWFPADSALEVHDIMTPTRCEYDPSLVGRPLRLTDVPRSSRQISRWAICEEITGDV